MKRFLCKILFILIPCCAALPALAQYRDSSYGDLYDSETVKSFKEHISYIAGSQMEGRKAGSEGERMTAEYVYEMLSDYGVDMLTGASGEVFGICTDADTLISRNVYGFIQGYDRKLNDRYIVVGAHLDNLGTHTMTVDGESVDGIYYGANSNASGVAMLLELARLASTNSLLFRRSIIFVAFGSSCNSFAGSWAWLNRSFSDKSNIDAMIDLDMLGTADQSGFFAFTSSNNDLNSLLTDVSSALQPLKPVLLANSPYPSDYVSFYDSRIPSIMFTTGRYPEHNTFRDTPDIIDYESMEMELEYIYNFLQAIVNRNDAPQFFSESREPVKRASTQSDVVSFYDCEVKPSFLGSYDPSDFLKKWVYQYLKYPKDAIERGIQGTVQVNFIIEKDGKLTNATIVKSVHPLLDDEAIKVINASPKWKPAKVHGQKVRSAMTIPIDFRLEKKGGRKKIGINGNI